MQINVLSQSLQSQYYLDLQYLRIVSECRQTSKKKKKITLLSLDSVITINLSNLSKGLSKVIESFKISLILQNYAHSFAKIMSIECLFISLLKCNINQPIQSITHGCVNVHKICMSLKLYISLTASHSATFQNLHPLCSCLVKRSA